MTVEQKEICRLILQKYGEENEVDMCIEECSELTKALLKFRRRKRGELLPETVSSLLENIKEEIADVEIMLTQMKILYDCEEEVKELIDYKLNRQVKERM